MTGGTYENPVVSGFAFSLPIFFILVLIAPVTAAAYLHYINRNKTTMIHSAQLM